MELALGRFEEMKALEEAYKDLEERMEARTWSSGPKGPHGRARHERKRAFRWIQRRAMTGGRR